MNILGPVQRLGKALMLPIAILPIAALLLRLGASDILNIPFTHPEMSCRGLKPGPSILKHGGSVSKGLSVH